MSEMLKPGPVCVDIEGTALTDHERERLRHPMTGMVILFTRNYRTRRQLKALCDEIHAVRPGILIAVDEILAEKRLRHIESFLENEPDALCLTSGAHKVFLPDR